MGKGVGTRDVSFLYDVVHQAEPVPPSLSKLDKSAVRAEAISVSDFFLSCIYYYFGGYYGALYLANYIDKNILKFESKMKKYLPVLKRFFIVTFLFLCFKLAVETALHYKQITDL